MALVIANRVRETSTTTGTGTYTLAGAETGYRTFSTAIGNTNTCPYFASMGANWEAGTGTVGAGTLARTSVIASSNGNNPVDWAAGTKQVICAPHAAVLPLLTLANNWLETQTVQGVSKDITLEARCDGDFTPRLALRKANTSGHTARHWQFRIDSVGDYLIRDNTAPADRLEIDIAGHVKPGADGVQNLGLDALRWLGAFLADSISIEKAGNVEVDVRATGDSATPQLRLRKTDISADTAREWTLGVNTAGNLRVRDETGDALRLQLTTAGVLASGATGTQDLGASSNEWKDLYLVNSPTVSSDERRKRDIEGADLGLEFVLRLRPVSFCWRDSEDRRRHYGLIAQELEAALEGREFGGLYHDAESDSYHLAPDQLVPVLIKAVQELTARVARLEAG